MERANATSTGILRTKSDQLIESIAAALKSSPSSGGSETLSRKSSRRLTPASPGRGKNTHIRKSRSAQMKFEVDELSSGAALSRASSASLGLSFSFTGFSMPPDQIADSRPFSDDDMIRKFTPNFIFSFINLISLSSKFMVIY